jgi:hypothetical protein
MNDRRKRTSHKRLNRQESADERFDVAFANRLAHLESFNKHLYRPNTYLHKWWARRCGSTFRLLLTRSASGTIMPPVVWRARSFWTRCWVAERPFTKPSAWAPA